MCIQMIKLTLSTALTFAPNVTKYSTIDTWPLYDARCNGVLCIYIAKYNMMLAIIRDWIFKNVHCMHNYKY